MRKLICVAFSIMLIVSSACKKEDVDDEKNSSKEDLESIVSSSILLYDISSNLENTFYNIMDDTLFIRDSRMTIDTPFDIAYGLLDSDNRTKYDSKFFLGSPSSKMLKYQFSQLPYPTPSYTCKNSITFYEMADRFTWEDFDTITCTQTLYDWFGSKCIVRNSDNQTDVIYSDTYAFTPDKIYMFQLSNGLFGAMHIGSSGWTELLEGKRYNIRLDFKTVNRKDPDYPKILKH